MFNLFVKSNSNKLIIESFCDFVTFMNTVCDGFFLLVTAYKMIMYACFFSLRS